MATGDTGRVRQVLINLLGNAIKFTPVSGNITVTTAIEHEGSCAWGAIRVTDTGPGIAEAEQLAIFEPYYRSDATAMLPGVGLGLAISQGLMQQMRGKLDLESDLGAGSTFAIRLPLLGGTGCSSEN